MKTITSAEFRKTYPRLAEPTIVTVNGHAIGTWQPGSIQATIEAIQMGGRLAQQAERDAILRKINRAK